LKFTLAIVALIAGYTWVLASRTPREVAHVVTFAVLALCAWRAARTGEWGLRRSEFLPALKAAVWVTAVAVAVIYASGWAAGTLQQRWRWTSLALLVPWAAGQQFALQTVLLREAQTVAGRRRGIALAALVFGALHLPNPFLAPVTLVAALVWCFLYDRHPNWLPLAFSHALSTFVILHSFDDSVTGRLRVGAAYLLLDR
jgi:membrane protease YdiL (CAAX protease family)